MPITMIEIGNKCMTVVESYIMCGRYGKINGRFAKIDGQICQFYTGYTT